MINIYKTNTMGQSRTGVVKPRPEVGPHTLALGEECLVSPLTL